MFHLYIPTIWIQVNHTGLQKQSPLMQEGIYAREGGESFERINDVHM